MQVGKSKVVTCDHCGEVVVGKPDSCTRNGEVRHFCQGNCMNEYFLEKLGNEAEKRANDRYRKEYKLLYSSICPSCKWRLRKLL